MPGQARVAREGTSMMAASTATETAPVTLGGKAHAAHSHADAWLRRGLIATLSGLYVAAAGLIGLFPIDGTDLDAFFFPSARIAVLGHPLQVYSLH